MIGRERIAEALGRERADLIGPKISLRMRLVDGVEITVWPAMPLADQWTEQHEDTR